MSSPVDISESGTQEMSPCFDIQEFRCRSQGSDGSFEDFLPAIEVMSICTQLTKQRNAFGSEKRRVRFTLIPAVFGVDGSSSPQVTSWGYKPVALPNSKENSSKRRRIDAAKMSRRDEWRFGEHSQRWGYSSPAFHCRSPPPQLYKLKNSPNKLVPNPVSQCAVPGMNIQQAILFQRTFNTRFLSANNEERRQHYNTPVCGLEGATPQTPLKKHVSMPDLKSINTGYGGKERKGSEQFVLRQRSKNVNTRENLENNTTGSKCPLCVSASHDFKKSFIQAKKIDIKLPCLDNHQETWINTKACTR